MPVVRALVLTHLGLTAALLLVFAGVVLCQRLLAVRTTRTASVLRSSYPSDDALATAVAPAVPVSAVVPEQEARPRRSTPAAAASVLDWTVDLRTADLDTADLDTEPRAGAGAPRAALQTSA